MYKMPEGRTGRSVTDFNTPEELKRALLSMKQAPKTVELSTITKQDYIAHRELKPNSKTIAAVGSSVVKIDEDLDWVIDGYDRENSEEISVEKEMRRLAVLKSYRLIGSGRDPGYERLISLTSRMFKVPMAMISIIDLGRLYLLASRGMGELGEIPRKSSICAHAIVSKLDLLVIPDLSKDTRFQDEDIVTGDSHLRFYAAAPLTCPEGYRLGTLCILDTEPRPEGLSLSQKQDLRELAGLVMDVMVEHRERKNYKFRHPAQMIASTSNDLMIPLKGVVFGLSTIEKDKSLVDDLSKQQKELFNTAVSCSSVLNRICKTSLEMYHEERKTGGPKEVKKGDDAKEESTLKVSELVKHIHMVMDPFPKQVPLIITTDPEVPPVIVGDDLKIFRSVVNYLTNACACTGVGSVHLMISVRKEEDDDDRNKSLVFTVEDTGPGISVDQYQYLFKPTENTEDAPMCETKIMNFSEAESVKSVTGKSGLGLYSVATQIESIGGKYGFRPRGFSEIGSERFDANGKPLSGSVFWFSIPMVVPSSDHSENAEDGKAAAKRKSDDVTSNTANAATEESSSDGHLWNTKDEAATLPPESSVARLSIESPENVEMFPGERKKRALLIEDSLVCRKTMSRVLTKLGFEVTQAVNGLEGLKEMHQTLFDIVFCDFLMPVMDGMDCVQQYRQFEVAHRPWFDQFIVGMSAHASDKDIERGLKVGMNDYRSKPVNMNILKEIMASPEFMYVSLRLDTIAAELDDEDERTLKRQRLDVSVDDMPRSTPSLQVCLIAEENDTISSLAQKAIEEKGWKAIVVHDGEAALRLLQMRNWDAVLLDDELPGLTSSRCISNFREWEKNNRVNRQKNVVQISSSFIPSHLETSSSMQLPSGFDGAIGKPLTLVALQTFLSQSADGATCGSRDIVSR